MRTRYSSGGYQAGEEGLHSTHGSQRHSEITVEEEMPPPMFDTRDAPRTSGYRPSAAGSTEGFPHVQHLDQGNSIIWNGAAYPAEMTPVDKAALEGAHGAAYVEMADLDPTKDQHLEPLPPPRIRASQVEQWLVPDLRTKHSDFVSGLLNLVVLLLFAFMAGQYGLYQTSPMAAAVRASEGNSTGTAGQQDLSWGPSNLASWLKFWSGNPAYIFDFGYLFTWGARYAPAIAAGQWWRIFTSVMIHSSTVHVLSNSLLWVVLAFPLERTYGPIRILLISIVSALGGTFLSMAFEDPCTLYVGASGAVFGFLGLYISDILLNFETMAMPLLRLALMLVCLGFMIAMEYIDTPLSVKRVSHLSHVGGLIAGLFVSFLFLPNLKDRRWKKVLKVRRRLNAVLGEPEEAVQEDPSMAHASCWTRNRWLYFLAWGLCAVVAVFFLVVLPLYIWKAHLPGLTCPQLGIEGLY